MSVRRSMRDESCTVFLPEFYWLLRGGELTVSDPVEFSHKQLHPTDEYCLTAEKKPLAAYTQAHDATSFASQYGPSAQCAEPVTRSSLPPNGLSVNASTT